MAKRGDADEAYTIYVPRNAAPNDADAASTIYQPDSLAKRGDADEAYSIYVPRDLTKRSDADNASYLK